MVIQQSTLRLDPPCHLPSTYTHVFCSEPSLHRDDKRHQLSTSSIDQENMPPSPKFTCEECGDQFLTQRMFNVHVRIMHRKVPCHTCPHCGGLYGHSADLSAHILKDHDSSKHQHKCDQCICRFKTAFQLRQHVQSAHRRAVLKCSQCPYETIFLVSLEKHLQSHVQLPEPNSCETSEGSGDLPLLEDCAGFDVEDISSEEGFVVSRSHTEMIPRRIGFIIAPGQS